MKNETGLLTKFKLLAKICVLAVFASLCYSMIDAQPVMGDTRPGQPTVELVLRDTTLGNALKLIAENNGYGFESQAPLDERVDVDMSGIGFDESVNRLLAGKPYNWVNENKILKVFKAVPTFENPQQDILTAPMVQDYAVPAAIPVEPEHKQILVLKNRRPDEVVALMTPLVKDVKLMADIRTNSILMSGSKEAIKETVAMANDLDGIQTIQGMEDRREYLSEVFTLDYVSDFDDLEKNLNFILYGSQQAQTNNQQQMQNQNQSLGGQVIEQPTVPVKKEYYLLDKIRRILMITAARDKMEIIREYFVRVNTPLPQVLIEAQIVALDDGFERSAGINWAFGGSYQGPIRPTDKPLGTPEAIVGGTPIDPAEGFQFGQWNLSNLVATLEMAQAQNKGKILSQPKLMTLSGNEAKIHIGTRYPYKASTTLNQSGGTAENVQYVDVGIILNVTPQVNTKSGTIVMKLAPEVSDVVGFRNDAPIITSRQTSTLVEVADGETVVIGGLLRDEDLKSKTGVPILRDIPVIGEFFKFSKKSNNKTNLVIMITPRVVNVKGITMKDVAIEEEKARKVKVSSEYRTMIEQLREKLDTPKKD